MAKQGSVLAVGKCLACLEFMCKYLDYSSLDLVSLCILYGKYQVVLSKKSLGVS